MKKEWQRQTVKRTHSKKSCLRAVRIAHANRNMKIDKGNKQRHQANSGSMCKENMPGCHVGLCKRPPWFTSSLSPASSFHPPTAVQTIPQYFSALMAKQQSVTLAKS